MGIRSLWNRMLGRRAFQGFALPGNATEGVPWSSGRDYRKFAEETYNKNAIAYRSISEVAQAVGSVGWRVYRRTMDGGRELVETHPLQDVLRRPNPSESLNFLIEKLESFKLISGNSFLQRIAPDSGVNAGLPQELHVLMPDRMKAIIKDGRLVEWQWRNGSDIRTYDFDPETGQSDILHLKKFHPTNDLYGLAPTEPGAININTNNHGSLWNMNLLKNSARPGSAVTISGWLSDDQYERLKQQMEEKFEGPENTGKTLLLESSPDAGKPSSIQPYGWTPKDVDFIEGLRETARRIALIYGVPPMLLGIPGDNTYSNYQEARLAFWEDTVIPELNYLRGELNNWLFAEEDQFFVDYDLAGIAALSPRLDKSWERAQQAEFLTVNEKRELAGYEERPEGDVVLVPASMIPLSAVGSVGEEDVDDEEERALVSLLKQGYSRDEAEEILSLDMGDAGA